MVERKTNYQRNVDYAIYIWRYAAALLHVRYVKSFD